MEEKDKTETKPEDFKELQEKAEKLGLSLGEYQDAKVTSGSDELEIRKS